MCEIMYKLCFPTVNGDLNFAGHLIWRARSGGLGQTGRPRRSLGAAAHSDTDLLGEWLCAWILDPGESMCRSGDTLHYSRIILLFLTWLNHKVI